MKLAAFFLVSASFAYLHPGVLAQDPAAGGQNPAQSFNESGKANIDGHTVSYLIRRLPVESFPDLPETITGFLSQRGCLIPQTYQAHRPENVVHGSFERPGSSDWAVLCSSHGTVELLVFFGISQSKPAVLASVPEVERIQRHDLSGVFEFDWGIDPASPQQVHEAQAGSQRRSPTLDHDALMDTVLNQKTVFHLYTHNSWTVVDSSH